MKAFSWPVERSTRRSIAMASRCGRKVQGNVTFLNGFSRWLNSFVLAIALLVAQWVGQSHALTHAVYDVSVAHSQNAGGGTIPAPLDHLRDRCISFHALDCVLEFPSLQLQHLLAEFEATASPASSLRPAKHTAYSSRAPPVLQALS